MDDRLTGRPHARTHAQGTAPARPQLVKGQPQQLSFLNNQSEKNSKEKTDVEKSVTKITSADINEVWDHYETVVPGGRRYALTAKRRQVIRKALEVRTKVECLAAIDGLAASRFHNGENDRHKKYLDIRYALKGIGPESDDERIDKAATWAHLTVVDLLADLPSDVRDMVRTRQKQVEAMLLQPDVANLRARGAYSEIFLREQFGLTAQIDSSGDIAWQRN